MVDGNAQFGRILSRRWLLASAAGGTIVLLLAVGVAPSQETGTTPLGQASGSALGSAASSVGPVSFWGASFDGYQQMTVVDSRTNRLAVYHVSQATGEIQLKSVRDISADLQLDHFNGSDPLPSAIRSMLNR